MSGDESNVQVRTATAGDLERVAQLAAKLVRLHHEWDASRFMVSEPLEEGYRWWLGRELKNPQAVVLVATIDDGGTERIAGYAYGRLEERDWNQLLDAHGALHDILVDDSARGRGVAKALLDEMLARLADMGAPRVVLHTASQNENAQRIFRAAGFRPTMIEMTRESDSKKR